MAPNEVILDTKVLIKFLIGLYDPEKLKRFGCSKEEHFKLVEYIKQFDKRLVSPHILAEMSNFIEKELKDGFSNFILSTQGVVGNIDEEYVCKDKIYTDIKCLSDFGFADASLAFLADKKRVILTEDGPFLSYCFNKRINAKHGGFL